MFHTSAEQESELKSDTSAKGDTVINHKKTNRSGHLCLFGEMSPLCLEYVSLGLSDLSGAIRVDVAFSCKGYGNEEAHIPFTEADGSSV